MKKQLKELQDLIIERIRNNQYNLINAELEGTYLRLKIEIDAILFRFSIPITKAFVAQHSNIIMLGGENDTHPKIAEILFDRHFEPIKKREIEKQIAELQKQLK